MCDAAWLGRVWDRMCRVIELPSRTPGTKVDVSICGMKIGELTDEAPVIDLRKRLLHAARLEGQIRKNPTRMTELSRQHAEGGILLLASEEGCQVPAALSFNNGVRATRSCMSGFLIRYDVHICADGGGTLKLVDDRPIDQRLGLAEFRSWAENDRRVNAALQTLAGKLPIELVEYIVELAF